MKTGEILRISIEMAVFLKWKAVHVLKTRPFQSKLAVEADRSPFAPSWGAVIVSLARFSLKLIILNTNTSGSLQNSIILNTKLIIFNAKLIILNKKIHHFKNNPSI